MRILHLVHQYLPEHVGGTELYTQALARFQVQQGHDVAVFYPTTEKAGEHQVHERDDEGVRVFAVPVGERSRTEVFFSTWRQRTLREGLAEVLALTQPDLVHVQHLMGLPAALIDQVQDAGVPFIVTLHDYWYVCANAQLLTNYNNTICGGPAAWVNCGRCALARAGLERGQLLAPALAPLLAHRALKLRKVLRAAEGLIAPTRFVREVYDSMGIEARRISVIPHGIDVPGSVQQAPRRERPVHTGRLHAVYVGGIARQKGVHVLVEAASRLSGEPITVTIYGDMTVDPEYAASLRAAAPDSGVAFAGPIARDRLWAMLLGEADVLVVPSIWYETAALVIQEGFAAGVPVVASRLGALAERVRDGADGLLFAPGDAAELRSKVRRLRDEPGLLNRLQQGIQPIQTIAEHTAAVGNVYEAALRQHTRSGNG